MSQFLFPLIIGIISGVSSSAPLGPTNFWIVSRVLSQPKGRLISFVCGVVLADVVYAYIAFWGFFTFLNNTAIGRAIGIFGSLVLMVLGISSILNKQTLPASKKISVAEQGLSSLKDFFIGISLCGANPTFVFFWVMVAGLLSKFGLTINWLSAFGVYLGIAIGDVIWYFTFASLVKKAKPWLDKWRRKVEVGIAFLLIGMGIVGLYEFI